MLYFVAAVGLVGCALGRIELGLGLGLGLVFGCMSPVDRICQYMCMCRFCKAVESGALFRCSIRVVYNYSNE